MFDVLRVCIITAHFVCLVLNVQTFFTFVLFCWKTHPEGHQWVAHSVNRKPHLEHDARCSAQSPDKFTTVDLFFCFCFLMSTVIHVHKVLRYPQLSWQLHNYQFDPPQVISSPAPFSLLLWQKEEKIFDKFMKTIFWLGSCVLPFWILVSGPRGCMFTITIRR